MKLEISLSGYAGSEQNLVTLTTPVPNGELHYFGDDSPMNHNPSARHLNEQLENHFVPSGIKRRKKKKKSKEVEAKVDLKKEDDGLGEHAENEGRHVLPNGADMYYGLLPLEHNPISHMVLSSGVQSVVKIKSEKEE